MTPLGKLLTGSAVNTYMTRKTYSGTLCVTDWLPQSSDLNIVEALRDNLERENVRYPAGTWPHLEDTENKL